MVTVTINIKPYLAGYMYVRYRQSLEPDPENQSHSSSPSSSKRLIPIHLSHITPVYHFLHQFLSMKYFADEGQIVDEGSDKLE